MLLPLWVTGVAVCTAVMHHQVSVDGPCQCCCQLGSHGKCLPYHYPHAHITAMIISVVSSTQSKGKRAEVGIVVGVAVCCRKVGSNSTCSGSGGGCQ